MRRAKEKTKKKKRGSLATCDFRSIAPAVAPKVGEYTQFSWWWIEEGGRARYSPDEHGSRVELGS